MRLIDADEYIEKLRDRIRIEPTWDHSGLRIAIFELHKMPTAERVGKWIRHPEVKNIYGGVYIECSECREKYVVQYVEDEKFCRNCGARMRGDGDE